MTRRTSAILLLLVLAALAGCSRGSSELARVGSTVITREDFELAARMNGAAYAPNDSGRAQLLDDLIKRQLLIEAAKQQGYYRDSTFLEYTTRIRDEVTRKALVDAYVAGVKVSEAEARALYDRQATEAQARVILTWDQSAARAARAELDRGMDFALVAARFNTPGQVPPGGDIGWVRPGTLVRSLDQALLEAPVGRVMGPYEQPGVGWFLIRIEQRRPAERPAYEEAREQLLQVLRQRKQGALTQRAVRQLMAAYQVRLARGGAQFMAQRFKPSSDPMAQQNLLDAGLSEHERGIVLATWTGGKYTLGDAQHDIQVGGSAPNVWLLPLVERWIESQVLQRALRAESQRRRLAEEPLHARMIRERENEYLLEAYYGREIARPMEVSEADLRAEHLARSRDFQRLVAADLRLTVVPDSAAALRVLDHGAHAADLGQAVAMANAGVAVEPYTVRYPNTSPLWQALHSRLLAMRPGEISGPFQTPMGWLIIQLVSKEQMPDTFEQLPPALLEQLRTTAVERLREARFVALTDSLRRAIGVTVNREALARIPWPPAAPGLPPGFGTRG